ncbi:21128_t:CDS:2 [Gigaspora rosea]|nr:21128_t:CDS:2 [Gigaspora rosea]
MVKTALILWKQSGGGATSAEILRTQMGLYKNSEPPFKEKFVESVDNVRTPDHIRTLALRLNAVTPHNAACESIFSILNWINIPRLESMAQIHSYLVTNARSELKFVESEILQEKLMQIFDEFAYAMIEECDMFDDNDNSEEFVNEESEEKSEGELTDIENENSFQLEIENFIELEHRMLNDDDAYGSSDVINHGDPDFDVDIV